MVPVIPDAAKPFGTLGSVEHTAGAELLATDDLLEAIDDALVDTADDTTELATEEEDGLDEDTSDEDDLEEDAGDEEVTIPRVP